MRRTLILISMLALLAIRCTQKEPSTASSTAASTPAPEVKFRFKPGSETGITFSNNLHEGPNTNILRYEYFYNGGGVAAGDLNGDGLIDLYFTSNMESNRLYMNKGDMKFSEVTNQSGAIGRSGPWK